MPAEPTENRRPQMNFTGRRGPVMMTEKPELKNTRGTIMRILAYMAERKRVLVIVFLCALATTVITIIGTRMNGYIIDTYIADKNIQGLAITCLLLAGMYLFGVISNYTQNILMIRTAQHTCAAIRRDLFERVQRLPLSYIDSHSSGDLMSRLTNDVDNINNAMAQTVVQLFSSVISITGMLIAMLLLSPFLTLICLVMTPVTFFMSRGIARVAQHFFIDQQKVLGQLNGYTEEMISGTRVIRQFSREKDVIHTFNELNEQLVQNSFRAQAVSGIIGPCNNMINNISYLLVAVTGGIAVINGTNAITVGVVFSFLLYMRNFTNPINNILNLINSLQLALASGERIFEVMDEEIETDAPDATPAAEIQGHITMEHIDFSYIPDKPVLKDAAITAEPGQVIAIVGPTGAGKTTIINLLTRFYDADNGAILIDEKPVQSLTRTSLRQSISLVLQDMFLFSDTIRENIRFGRISATDADVESAARKANAHDFIMQLPEGYDTVLSDNGTNLSQGQRQLLSIARAIISDASILILDEATSSIDTRTELIVQNALLELMKGRTSFVIAHRLSTIRNADKIIVIDDGRVREEGTHDELIKADGFYASMYQSQFHNH